MTALCGGGASQARPGLIGNSFATAAGIVSYLSTFLPLPLAIAIGAIAAVETFEVGLYCATDPPPDPGLIPQDMVDLLDPSHLETFLPAEAKVRQWWRHVYWWQVCECTSVATPPLPPPSNPGNQSQNGGLPSGGTTNCYTSDAGYTTTGVASSFTPLDLTPIWMPQTTDTIAVSATFQGHSVSGRAFRLPANVVDLGFSTVNQGAASPAPVNAVDCSVLVYNASGTQVTAHQFLSSQAATIGVSGPGTFLPSGSAYVAILGINTLDASVSGKVMSWNVTFSFKCAGDGVSSPCCPPDPSLELKINQLYQLVLNLQNPAVVSPPTGWHDGTRHSSLRGAGSFTIASGTIGVRLEVTTPPTGVNVDPGNPDFYWDMGFITPYALTSPLRGVRLVFLNQSYALPEFSDQVGYTLKHGTVIDAIELLPTTA